MNHGEAGGLFANGVRVPLLGVAIDVQAAGAAARVTVAQRYRNAEKVPVEAVYSFPLEESCAVCGFEVQIGEKHIVGKVEERERAFDRYDEAMAQGHGAYLVDQDRPNIFTASVGNLLPGQEAVVRLSYATELEQHGASIRLMIPTTISPRYIPQAQLRTMEPSELDHIAPPVQNAVPYGLALSVDLTAASDLREVSCPSHPARVRMEGRTVHVELMGENVQLDQDFVLNLELAQPHLATALVARDGEGARIAMLNLFPDLSKFKRGSCEFVFIVDRSGSMGGPSIEQARAALLLCLRSMEEGDRFNAVGFGDHFVKLFPESVPYTQQSMEDAERRIRTWNADLGGTEILAPLKAVLEAQAPEGATRLVVLLTDGQVGNEDACIALAASNAKRNRIFTFGVGHGASEHLLRGLARASGGQAEFIQPNERIEPKVLRQFARMASAHLKNVRFDWGGLHTDLVAPCEAPPMFDGDRLTVYARVTGGVPGEAAVLADGPEGTLRFPVFVDLEKPLAESALPVLMARKAIQDLEEGRAPEAKLGSAQRGRKEERVRARVLELALRYQLMSSATSFVAVEEREAGVQTQPAELRRVPVALTKGWGGAAEDGLLHAQFGAVPMAGGKATLMRSVARARMSPASLDASLAPKPGIFSKLRRAFGGGQPPPAAPAGEEIVFDDIELMPSDGGGQDEYKLGVSDACLLESSDNAGSLDLMPLTSAQQADGAFVLNKDIAAFAHCTLEELEHAADGLAVPKTLARRVLATLLALHFLRNRFGNRKVEWALIAKKAERWLKSHRLPMPPGFNDLDDWAKSLVADET